MELKFKEVDLIVIIAEAEENGVYLSVSTVKLVVVASFRAAAYFPNDILPPSSKYLSSLSINK